MKRYIALMCLLELSVVNAHYAKKCCKKPVCYSEPCEVSKTPVCVPSIVAPQAYKMHDSYFGVDQYVFKRDPDSWGWTQLMWIAALDQVERLTYVLNLIEQRYGNDKEKLVEILNTADHHGRTPLYLTAEWFNQASMEVLLNYAGRWFGDRPDLYLAFLDAQEDHLKWTSLSSSVYQSFSRGMETLIEAAVKYLGQETQEFKTFINAKTIFGRTPLALAIEPWDRLYLEARGAVRDIDAEFTFPAHEDLKDKLMRYAAYEGFEKELKNVLDKAAEVYVDKYDYLLDFITTRNGAGWTALMNAAADGNEKYVDLILKAVNRYFKDKAWIAFIMNISDIHGRTVWHLTISRRQVKVLEKLIENQWEIAKNRKQPFLRIMLNRTELNGFTPLIAAAYESADDNATFAMIKMIVHRMDDVLGRGSPEFNTVINRKDLDGYTALSYAVTPRVAKFLKSYGAVRS